MSKKFSALDRDFMQQALDLASKGAEKVSPNPMVGAVVVKKGKVLGQGYYRRYGGPHAEVNALRGVSAKALRGATLYVTLEPCVVFEGKKTGSCSELLVKNGFRRVVVAGKDPHPAVAGRGLRFLRRHGVDVLVGLEREQARQLNRVYEKNVTTSLPYVALKLAHTLDGRIACADGSSRWITGKEARRQVHELRASFDAVLTTSTTVNVDDPHLGVRHGKGKDPLRIVIDRSLTTSPQAQVYRDDNVLLVSEKSPTVAYRGEALRISSGETLHNVFHALFTRGISKVLIEAGGTFAASILREQLVDYSYAFVAPKFLGGDGIAAMQSLNIKHVTGAICLENMATGVVGHDILVEGTVRYPS